MEWFVRDLDLHPRHLSNIVKHSTSRIRLVDTEDWRNLCIRQPAMSNGKKPSHIALPAKPSPQDVFSASSALDSAPTPSSANESPSGTLHRNVFDSINSRKSNNRSHLSPSFGGGSRKPTFVEQVHPRLRGASGTHERPARQSFSNQNRRASRVTSMHSTKRRTLMSPGADGDEAGSQFEAEGKPAIPVLVPGIRPAYSTPLPLLAMIVLSIVSLHDLDLYEYMLSD